VGGREIRDFWLWVGAGLGLGIWGCGWAREGFWGGNGLATPPQTSPVAGVRWSVGPTMMYVFHPIRSSIFKDHFRLSS